MTNPSKAKGSKFEREIVDYARAHGFPQAARTLAGGVNDRGDISSIPGWVVEAKNTARTDLGEQLAEAEKEAANAGVTRFALVKRRRGKPVAEAYAALPLWLLVELMGEG